MKIDNNEPKRSMAYKNRNNILINQANTISLWSMFVKKRKERVHGNKKGVLTGTPFYSFIILRRSRRVSAFLIILRQLCH